MDKIINKIITKIPYLMLGLWVVLFFNHYARGLVVGPLVLMFPILIAFCIANKSEC